MLFAIESVVAAGIKHFILAWKNSASVEGPKAASRSWASAAPTCLPLKKATSGNHPTGAER